MGNKDLPNLLLPHLVLTREWIIYSRKEKSKKLYVDRAIRCLLQFGLYLFEEREKQKIVLSRTLRLLHQF